MPFPIYLSSHPSKRPAFVRDKVPARPIDVASNSALSQAGPEWAHIHRECCGCRPKPMQPCNTIRVSMSCLYFEHGEKAVSR